MEVVECESGKVLKILYFGECIGIGYDCVF